MKNMKIMGVVGVMGVMGIMAAMAQEVPLPPPEPVIGEIKAEAKALPAYAVTNIFERDCPICGCTVRVPGRKLMNSGGPMLPGGGCISERSATVQCDCGELLTVRRAFLMPSDQGRIANQKSKKMKLSKVVMANPWVMAKPMAKLAAPKEERKRAGPMFALRLANY